MIWGMRVAVEPKDLEQLFSGISAMQTSIHAAFAKRSSTPADGSPADIEARDHDRGAQGRAAHLYGYFAFIVADDHLGALARIAHSGSTLAPATCTRAVLEAAALCSWLCDPKASMTERVARSFAYQYEGLCQQAKLSVTREPSAEMHIIALETEALSLGYRPVLQNGRRAGVAKRMPSTTQLIRMALEDPVGHTFVDAYRFFSGIAHGHFFAIQQFGFKPIDNPDTSSPERVQLTKHNDPATLAFCGANSVLAYTHAIGRLARLYGWGEVMPLIEVAYDQMGIRSIFKMPAEA